MDLRAGVKAKQQGNLALSRKLLAQYELHIFLPLLALIKSEELSRPLYPSPLTGFRRHLI